VITTLGCATYSETLQATVNAVDQGNYTAAIQEMSRKIGSPPNESIPADLPVDGPLWLLERGTLLQATAAFEFSARDWTAADDGLEWLDLSANGLATIGRYIYSDDVGPYRAPPSERLALNALNSLNYLTRGDLSGAAVEARRYTVMRDYLDSQAVEARSPLGAYLAGFVFEQRGEGDRALRYYDEALAAGAPESALAAPVARLTRLFPYRTPRLSALARQEAVGPNQGMGAELLLVIATGRVPPKRPKRIPVGAAIGIAGVYFTGDLKVLDRSAMKVVSYPALGPGVSGDTIRGIEIDGKTATATVVANFSAQVRREYKELEPRILAAALSRLLVRAATAEGVRAASRGKDDWVGALTANLVEAAMVAGDRPDTRSWTLLPGRVAVVRARLSSGSHTVRVQLQGGTREFEVDVPERGFVTLVVTSPR
jgi:hypothetical protein